MSALAESCLRHLAENGFGAAVSIGGGIGLLHYLDFRDTNDVDVWWEHGATQETRDQVIALVENFLRSQGPTRVRQAGVDTISVELLKRGTRTKVFSFQVSFRSVRLEPPTEAPWLPIKLDTLPDLIASKTMALIDRGAPRDFVDIHRICDGVLTPAACWQLWIERQKKANKPFDVDTARISIEQHLRKIEAYRPLDQIADPVNRSRAKTIRDWFRQVFIHARLD